jgi:hypothetical protein
MAKFNSEGGGGTGAVSAAPASTPAPVAAPTNTPAAAPAAPAASPSGPAAGAPPGTPAAPSTATPAAPAAPAGKLIDTLPQRGTSEYWAKFGELSHDQRLQVEREWNDRDSGLDKAPEKPPEADPAAQPLPGDKPKGDEEIFVTPEDLAKADPKVKAVVEHMQQTIDEFAPFMEESFGKGLATFMQDPIIAARVKELADGKQWEPGELAKGFDAKSYLTTEALQGLDPISDPEGFAQKVGALLQKAHQDGLKHGGTAKEYEMNQKVALAERKSFFESGFKGLIDAHPELKPKDPTVANLSDPKHPMYPFVQWSAKNLGDKYFVNPENKLPFESAYAAFLASTGDLNNAIKKTVENTRMKFIRTVTDAQTHAATVGRNTPSAAPPVTSPVPGLDVQRYLNDDAYARSFYDNADHPTRLKLEQVRYGNKVT